MAGIPKVKAGSVKNTTKQSTKGGIPKTSSNKTTLKYSKGGKVKKSKSC